MRILDEFDPSEYPHEGEVLTLEMAEKACFYSIAAFKDITDEYIMSGQCTEPYETLARMMKLVMFKLSYLQTRWGKDFPVASLIDPENMQ